MGGRIVGEVFISLLHAAPKSYVNVQPNWQTTLATRKGNPEGFSMIDILTFASADPASRGQ